jgi:hypothetical protein
MIWLLPPSLPPYSRQQVLSLSQSSCVSRVKLTKGDGGEERGGGRSQKFRQREIPPYLPSLPPYSRQIVLSLSVFLCVAGEAYGQETEVRIGEGEGAKLYDGEKAWSSKIH